MVLQHGAAQATHPKRRDHPEPGLRRGHSVPSSLELFSALGQGPEASLPCWLLCLWWDTPPEVCQDTEDRQRSLPSFWASYTRSTQVAYEERDWRRKAWLTFLLAGPKRAGRDLGS